MNWYLNKKIATKLILGFSVVLLLTVFVGVLSLQRLAAVQATAEDLGGKQMVGTQTLGQLALAVSSFRRWEMRTLLVMSDAKSLQAAETGLQGALESVKKLQAKYEAAIDDPKEKELYETFQREWAAYQADGQKLMDLIHANKQREATEYLANEEFTQYGKAQAAVDTQVQFQDAMTKEAVKNSGAIYASARIWVIAVLSGCVVIGLLLGLWIARQISRPVREVGQRAKQIASGDLTGEEISVQSSDEVGELERDINTMQKAIRDLIVSITHNAERVASVSEQFSATTREIAANSEETSAQANVVTTATEEVNKNLQTVATATEEMSATISEISKSATQAAKVAGEALKAALETNTTVSKLGESSAEIGQVIKVITSIAQQTNLLALNATIEAARAGEAGKGFAVVANEVKELATQTAKATGDISQKIAAIQADTKAAVEAIGTISGIIGQVNDISSTIATAVEEQSATTSEMLRNVSDAAKGSGEVARNISGVAQAAQSTSTGANDSSRAAEQLVETSAELRSLVERFKIESNGSGNGGAQYANPN